MHGVDATGRDYLTNLHVNKKKWFFFLPLLVKTAFLRGYFFGALSFSLYFVFLTHYRSSVCYKRSLGLWSQSGSSTTTRGSRPTGFGSRLDCDRKCLCGSNRSGQARSPSRVPVWQGYACHYMKQYPLHPVCTSNKHNLQLWSQLRETTALSPHWWIPRGSLHQYKRLYVNISGKPKL